MTDMHSAQIRTNKRRRCDEKTYITSEPSPSLPFSVADVEVALRQNKRKHKMSFDDDFDMARGCDFT
eukprot:1349523-Rhodomonas_salina.1